MTSSRSSTMAEHAPGSPFAAGVVVAARLLAASALRPDGARRQCLRQLPREQCLSKAGSAMRQPAASRFRDALEAGRLYRRQRAQIGGDRACVDERVRRTGPDQRQGLLDKNLLAIEA